MKFKCNVDTHIASNSYVMLCNVDTHTYLQGACLTAQERTKPFFFFRQGWTRTDTKIFRHPKVKVKESEASYVLRVGVGWGQGWAWVWRRSVWGKRKTQETFAETNTTYLS